MDEKSVFEKAVEARALVAKVKVLVDAAEETWATAYREANPGAELPSDPEPEWSEPDDEAEAARDLNVARLGGELVSARIALNAAGQAARDATRRAMVAASLEGRAAWKKRHGLE